MRKIAIDVYNESGFDSKQFTTVENTSNMTPEFTLEETVHLAVESEENTWAFLPWVEAGVKKEGELDDDGPRPCWRVQDLGNWGCVLIGAELG